VNFNNLHNIYLKILYILLLTFIYEICKNIASTDSLVFESPFLHLSISIALGCNPHSLHKPQTVIIADFCFGKQCLCCLLTFVFKFAEKTKTT